MVFWRLCFAYCPTAFPSFSTPDAGKKLPSSSEQNGGGQPIAAAPLGSDLCVSRATKVHLAFFSTHPPCLVHIRLETLTHLSLLVRHEGNRDAFPTRSIRARTQTRLILVYAGASSGCASLHVGAMGQTGVCAETAKLLRSDSSAAHVKITSPWLVVSPLPLSPLTQQNLKGTSSRY